MNGAESLVRSLIASGVDTCFANPGTSEMHFVAALDKVEGMRCVLGMAETVVTGCADGYQAFKVLYDKFGVKGDLEVLHITEYIDKLIKEGHTLIISSHTMDDAAHCQRLAFMRQGKIIAAGSPRELRQKTGQADASLEDAFIYFIKKGEQGA